ncbi:MAG: alkaline phosphatase family protein [Pseudobdellovibrio sp.]
MLKLAYFLVLILSSQFTFAGPGNGKYFNKVIFIVFENTNYKDAIQQPFFKELANNGAHFSGLAAITHPSQPNYIALTSGSLNGVKGNNPINLNVKHIGDLLEAKELTWKAYADDYPGNCFTGTASNAYARRHNPFISYLNIQKDAKRCANIVNSSAFYQDVKNNSLPNYSFFIPNVKNDGHDTGVAFADKWYRKTFQSLFSNLDLMKDTLIITTFDENGGAAGNVVYTNFNGPMVRGGIVIPDRLTFFSLIKLIEQNWTLDSLGKEDLGAASIPNVWQ